MHETLQITTSWLCLKEKTKKIKFAVLQTPSQTLPFTGLLFTNTLKNGISFKFRHFLSNFDQSGSISKQNSYFLHDILTQIRKADHSIFQN